MKQLIFAAALALGVTGPCLAQTSAPSSDPNAHSPPATSPADPAGSSMTEQGKVKPCNKMSSDTSDRSGGAEKRSAASTDNAGGAVSGSGC